jgi:hypothetical protein
MSTCDDRDQAMPKVGTTIFVDLIDLLRKVLGQPDEAVTDAAVDVTVTAPDDSDVPVSTVEESSNNYRVSFLPTLPGRYEIEIHAEKDGLHLTDDTSMRVRQ